ncbi:hypothetical protein GOV03_01390 [Candidatus Woesearchaeota archaeon]|nr:hypothetical protein [Candidatus Woesearchaeota archaeon]
MGFMKQALYVGALIGTLVGGVCFENYRMNRDKVPEVMIAEDLNEDGIPDLAAYSSSGRRTNVYLGTVFGTKLIFTGIDAIIKAVPKDASPAVLEEKLKIIQDNVTSLEKELREQETY